MDTSERRSHWDSVYEARAPEEVSWFQPSPDRSLALIERELPHPDVAFCVLLPYERGDLVNRIHQQGEIDSLEHTAEGSLVTGRANPDLAGELEQYAVPTPA